MWEAIALDSSLIEIWDEQMQVQSCALALLIVIRIRSTKVLVREARFWFMMICMPFEGMAAEMLVTAVASMSKFPQIWNNINLTIPFFVSASLSISPGSCRVLIFPVGKTAEAVGANVGERIS